MDKNVKKGGSLRRPSSLSSTLHVPRGAARGPHEDSPEIIIQARRKSGRQKEAILMADEENNYRKKVTRTRRDRNEELERRLRHYSRVSLSRTKSKSRKRLDEGSDDDSQDESQLSAHHCCCNHRVCSCQGGSKRRASVGRAASALAEDSTKTLRGRSRVKSRNHRSHSHRNHKSRCTTSSAGRRNRSSCHPKSRHTEISSTSTEETALVSKLSKAERSKSRPKKNSVKFALEQPDMPLIKQQPPFHCGDSVMNHSQPIVRTVAGGDSYQQGSQQPNQSQNSSANGSRSEQPANSNDRQLDSATETASMDQDALESPEVQNPCTEAPPTLERLQTQPLVRTNRGQVRSSSQTQEEIDLVKTALLQHISKMVKRRADPVKNSPTSTARDKSAVDQTHEIPSSRENTPASSIGRDPRAVMHATLEQQQESVRVRTGREANHHQQPSGTGGSSGRRIQHATYGGSGRQQRPNASGGHQHRNAHQGQHGQSSKTVKYRTTLPPSSFSGGLPMSALNGRSSNVTKGNMPISHLPGQTEQMKVSNVVVGSQQVVSSLAATQQDLIAASVQQATSRKTRSANEFHQGQTNPQGLNSGTELAKPAVSGKLLVSQGNEKLCYYEEDLPKEPAGPHMLKPKASEMPSPFYKQRAAGPVYAPNFFPDIEQIIAERIKVVGTPGVDSKQGKRVIKMHPFRLYDQPPPPENKNPLAHLAPTDDTGSLCYNDGGAPVGGAHAMVRQSQNYHRSSRTRRAPQAHSESQSGSYVRKPSGRSQPVCCDLPRSSDNEDNRDTVEPRKMRLPATAEAAYDNDSSRDSNDDDLDAGADEQQSSCSQRSSNQKTFVGRISQALNGLGRCMADESASSSSWSIHDGEIRKSSGGSSKKKRHRVNLKAYQREIAALVNKKQKSPKPVEDEPSNKSDDGRLTSGESAYAESSRGRSGGKDPAAEVLITNLPRMEASIESARVASSVSEKKHSVRFSFAEKAAEDSEHDGQILNWGRPKKYADYRHMEEPKSGREVVQICPRRTFVEPVLTLKSAAAGARGDGGSPVANSERQDLDDREHYDREKEAFKTAYHQKFYERLNAIIKADVEKDQGSEPSTRTPPGQNGSQKPTVGLQGKRKGILKVRTTELRKPFVAYSSEETGATAISDPLVDELDDGMFFEINEKPYRPPHPLEEVGSSRAHAGASISQQSTSSPSEEDPCCPTVKANLCPKTKPRRKAPFSDCIMRIPKYFPQIKEKEPSEDSEESPVSIDPFCPPEKGLEHMIPKMPPEMLNEIAIAIERRKKEIEAEQASRVCRTMPPAAAIAKELEPKPCAKPTKKCKEKNPICQQFEDESEEEEPECTSAAIRERIARELKARKKAAYGC